MKMFLILMLVSGVAYGTGQPKEPETKITTQATAIAKAGAAATASQKQSQKTEQDLEFNYNSEYERSAPAVTAISGHSTADMLVCYGLGGSSPGGAATGLWCHLQRDLYAEHRMEFLAGIGLHRQAAKAYCDRKLHRQDFKSRRDCNTKMSEALKDQKIVVSVKHIEVKPEEVCEGNYGEVVVKEFIDNKSGVKVLYDCKQRTGKSG